MSTLVTFCKVDPLYPNIYANESFIEEALEKLSKFPEFISAKKANLTLNPFCDISVFPGTYFYPYMMWNIFDLFYKNGTILDAYRFVDTYSIHFFGYHTRYTKASPGDRNWYEFFAAHNCPRTYDYVKSNKLFF